ncbi:MAG: hypothetical protein ACI8RZ_005000 [Myxococcota bacterium]|jgi:uncharacterized protein (DUF58 family)
MLQPTPLNLRLLAIGLPLSLLPAILDVRLWPVWVVAVGIWALLTGLDAILLPRTSELRWSLTLPPSLYIGREQPAVLQVDGVADGRAEAMLDLSEEAAPTEPTAFLGSTSTLTLRPTRRGTLTISQAWVRRTGPLGLMRRISTLPIDRELVVVPDAPRVQAEALRFFGGRSHTGVKVEKFVGDGSEFDSLREFLPGMDRRTIDWKASARHVRLLAREHRAERNHQIIIAADTGRLMAEPLDGIPRLDHAVHAALLMAWVSLRHGDRVGLFAFDDAPRGFALPRSGRAAFGGLLSLCAGLAYREAETNFTLGLTDLMTRLRRRSLVVVLTDFADTVTAELMVDNLGRLARRHLVIFVALSDPLLLRLASGELGEMADVERAVVAESLLSDREVVLARLRRMGVLVVDAPPGRVGPALVNRYLDIARRERI